MSEGGKCSFDVEFFGSNDYDTTRFANKLLEGYWTEGVDLKVVRGQLENKIDELNDFVLNRVDYFKVQSTLCGFSEEMKWAIRELNTKVNELKDKCTSSYKGKIGGREESLKAFNELNELLYERTRVIAEKCRLEAEQMWTSLKNRVDSDMGNGEFKCVAEMVRAAKNNLKGVTKDENLEMKKRIIEEVEITLLETLQEGKLMEKYANDIQKLRELRDISIVIDNGFFFFNLQLKSLRSDIEKMWKDISYVYKTTSRSENSFEECLDKFFDRSIEYIVEELRRIKEIAQNEETLAAISLIDIFTRLTPSFLRRFNAYIYSNENLSITNFINIYDTCQRFSLKFESLILNFINNKTLSRKIIASKSFSDYSKSLFECFIICQDDLLESEIALLGNSAQNLAQKLVEIKRMHENKSLITYYHLLDDFFDYVDNSISRFVITSQGLSISLLIPRLNSILEETFIKIFYIICNKPESPNSLNKKPFPDLDIETRLKISMGECRDNNQNRTQFTRLIDGLSYCAKFCFHINNISNKISNTRTLNPKYPPPSFQESEKDSTLSIASSQVLYMQRGLIEGNEKLRKTIAASVHNRIESMDYYNNCSKLTLELFKTCSKSLTSMTAFCQKSLLENIIRPVEENFVQIGIEQPNDTYLETEENLETFPSHAVTQIGEYFLTIPLILDPYIEEKTLSFSLDTLPTSDDITKELELLSIPNKSVDSKNSGYEDYTLARWIHAILLLAVEKFRLIVDGNTKATKNKLNATSQLNADVEYLDRIVNSLDIDLVCPFMKCVENL